MGLTWDQLVAIAVRTGYPVRTNRRAGQGVMGTIYGTGLHHTGTPASAPGDYPSLGIVSDGRSDLRGSLCNYGLGRSGTIYPVTEGVAWHFGVGSWAGIADGNGHFLGIEAENPGDSRWPAAQLDAYQRLVASILSFSGRSTDWDVRHLDFATPTGRKVDPAGINMTTFDGRVNAMLANPATINRNYGKPAPASTSKGFFMALTDSEQKELLTLARTTNKTLTLGDAASWLYRSLYRPLRYGDSGPGTAPDGNPSLADLTRRLEALETAQVPPTSP